MSELARILIFTGDGKGKTTAAIGMAVRASGHGHRVKVIQFVKGADSGEHDAIEKASHIDIVQTGLGFLPKVGSAEFDKHKQAAKDGLLLAKEIIDSKEFQILVLDEICVAVSKGLIEEGEVIEVVKGAAQDSCVVMTGRGATDGLIEIADTVSEIKCIKHGYKSGIKAQKGVEF
ncbi:MAG: cob(I)yrinic acid a,c-diamide adenosyltransferase [Planctomycetes bacterium]|nr:cob(I)yrinic acid a,c-diamide adenosyltransferase [Planctomycetota bacterium]MCK5563921.1 cob(I)yrinic acid a,c-diamide adenosyltransferase [Planctomycetota bacterium]